MKKLSVILAVTFFFVIISGGCANNSVGEGELLRIHVRANSNQAVDQSVKMVVKDKIVEYLSDELYYQTDYGEAIKTVEKSLTAIEAIANRALAENGMKYRATAKLKREYFPTRAYEDVVVESGVYDALIVELGKAEGDNWWCVIYPPLCFVNREEFGSEFRYKSKILELWRKYISPSN